MSANLDSPRVTYPFLSEIAQMRRRTRQHMQAGTNAAGLADAQPTVLRLLQETLAAELMCLSRYRRHSAMSGAASPQSLHEEFLKYTQQQQGQAELLARRIVELGGQADLRMQSASDPEDLDGAADDTLEDTLADMLEEELIAERIAIESYREIMQYVRANDPVTGELLASILAVELWHAEELARMRADVLHRDHGCTGATSTRLPQLSLQ